MVSFQTASKSSDGDNTIKKKKDNNKTHKNLYTTPKS